jgi:hypothetical protein
MIAAELKKFDEETGAVLIPPLPTMTPAVTQGIT